jgi:hypothetical protein
MMKIKAKQKINRTESWNGKGLENGRRRRRRRRRRKKNTRKRIRESKIPPPRVRSPPSKRIKGFSN